ncbi:MAG: glycosyltransferase family 2 protein [Methylobacterium frigidaeris]
MTLIFPDHPSFDVLCFESAMPGTATALATLARHPADAAAILRALATGKRVRAHNLATALLGAAPRWRCPAPAAAAAPEPHPDVTVLTPDALRQGGSGRAGIVLLTAPGHTLLPGTPARVAATFAAEPAVQALYGDAVAIDRTGRPLPLLRTAFDPDFLRAIDTIGPVAAFRSDALERLGGVPADLPGLEAAGLLLRLAAAEGEGAVRHVPAVLSLWRPWEAPDPVPPDAVLAARLRLAGAPAETGPGGVLALRRPLPAAIPAVSLIVPTRDRVDLLRTCLDSLVARTDWPEREIIVCDNDSREPGTHAYLRELERGGIARVVPCPGPFNFAAMNNRAAEEARGGLLAFVNNDVEAIHPDWLARMAREALRPEVGAVGAKLLDAEGRIQHGGIVLGAGGLVTHAHRHCPGEAPGYLHRLRATHRVSAVTAACLVVEARKFREVGGFDADAFAVDFNDVDLCLRLDRAGYRSLMVPGAVLHHREAASRRWTPAARERHAGEVERLRRRWGEALAADPWYPAGFDRRYGGYLRVIR